ncbi:transcriptional regulator [Thioalkalivibrio versutus]|uniref:Transcriptional regulator n=1 Tax=Thioalkalivibrio versutus TaxID=106634 RepID=A0A0G3G2B5_9GAMM|nr:WYL domain-containing protein [Thioalkalivibrio versutus]AKJ95345.1 transcriptional regulator [Thioalkalivibrio versutus]
MPEGQGMRATLQRRMLLLGMIPRQPRRVSAPDLVGRLQTRGLSTTLRTIERDLEALSGFLPLGRDERDRPYGWYWLSEAPLQDVPAMDPETALTLQILDAHSAQLLPPSARARLKPQAARAREVLDSTGEASGLSLWPERVRILSNGPPLTPPEMPDGVFLVLQQGLLERRCLDITYRSRSKGQVKDHRIHPLALVFREPVTYLLATMEPHQDVVHLAAHRIEAAALTDQPARDPEGGFDLDQIIRNGAFDYPEGDAIPLELRVNADLAYHLHEARLAEDQLIERGPDGTSRVTATVRDTARLKWWLLGLGAGVEVVGPPSLRDAVAQELESARLAYRTKDPA